MTLYRETTENIEVSVEPIYLEDQSDPQEGQYVWAYNVTLKNKGDQSVQLLNRYWHITDGNGTVKEVNGPGVVGHQPTLSPGEDFEYASGTPLRTPTGIMRGHYEMTYDDGTMFTITIPMFSLDSPEAYDMVN